MGRYRWPSLRQIARDFFADLREILAALKRREGQAAFLLMALTVMASIGLFFVVLGFDRLSDVSLVHSKWRPLQCHAPDNVKAMLIVVGGVVFAMLAVLALGEAMLFVDRKRRGLPGRPGAMIAPALAMLVVAVLGIVGMRIWC